MAPEWAFPIKPHEHLWHDLPPKVQKFWTSITPAYTETIWNKFNDGTYSDDVKKPYEEFSWSDMTEDEVEMALRIGYTEWNFAEEVSKETTSILSPSDDCV